MRKLAFEDIVPCIADFLECSSFCLLDDADLVTLRE